MGRGRAGTAAAAGLLMLAAFVFAAGPTAGVRAQAPPPRSGAPVQQLPSFRAGVDIVSLNVTVTDSSGRYVTDLTPDWFGVFEDGVKQDVTFFSRTSLPIALSLLLDTSASMEDRIGTAQEAAIGFARRLRGNDLGELIDFDREVRSSRVSPTTARRSNRRFAGRLPADRRRCTTRSTSR